MGPLRCLARMTSAMPLRALDRAETIGSVQCPGNGHQTVTVGVGLDHGQEAGSGCLLPNSAQVVLECGEIDAG